MERQTDGKVHWRRREQVPINGAAVRKAREAKDWSREKLAAELGCSYKTIERIETGNRPPGRQTVLALMELLGLTLADLGTDLEALLPPRDRSPRV